MNKLRMESPDLTAQNIEKLAALFPNCITEAPDGRGGIQRAVNFELLKQMLSPNVIDGDEAYEFTWVGKKASIVEANKPIRKTLRPCPEESKNWDTTENLYIEGDNLEVLKLLQESYLSKVKMIYIDPPYNTGNDFIYADDFMRSQEEENEQMGMYDEDENRLFKNTDTNGRFHSDWCSMIYSRLMLARNLLTDDGVIFISIDDRELDNMLKVCNEIFGRGNYVASIIWQKKYSPQNDARYFSNMHDYILCYAKHQNRMDSEGGWVRNLLPRNKEQNNRYKNPDNDPRGPWKAADLTSKTKAAGHSYAIVTPSGRKVFPTQGRQWAPAYSTYCHLLEDNRIWFGTNGDNVPSQKVFLSEVQDGQVPNTIWFRDEVGDSQSALKELVTLMNGKYFDTPKSVNLIKRVAYLGTNSGDIILDFFSGSATTAHAVMQLNAEDGGHRKFIMVQLPEPCGEKSEAYKAGYKNICEIGKERIRRAGEKIKAESPLMTQDLDVGFRVLKLDDTNMKDVYYTSDEYDQEMLAGLESNIKEDRSDLDLLFGCLLDWGLPLSLPYTSEQIEGCTVHTYNDGDLIACFDANVPESVVKKIAQRKPLRAVFRDSGFASSPEKINVFEIFKFYMPEDADDIGKRVKVI